MRNILAILFVVGLAFVLSGFIIFQEKWVIPAKYKTMENPYVDDESTLQYGKMLYAKHCKSCHGNFGKGDGPKAGGIETSCGDFSSVSFQKNSDGVIYYQSIIGRDEMPNYEKKIPDEEDRWSVVNYIRTLAE